ncbi:MAG: T9SS type A sorting domain-containing protein, partial [Bacteroidota bacterium]
QKGVIRALTIINAQGQVVHAIRNQSVGDTANAWQASNMAEGVYFYQAIIRNEQNITHNISGQIIVLK